MRISIIIPTIGSRNDELNRLLKSFTRQTQLPDEIIIVDQGKKGHMELTQNLDLPIKYFHVNFQSLTKARNFGVKKAIGDIIGFLDDDIVLDPEYVAGIHHFFADHTEALGVQGIITDFEEGHTKKVGGKKIIYFFYNILAKIFLLNNSSTKNRLLLSGRNQYASRVKEVTTCEWLSGIGNYKKEVFKEFLFDETLGGYALGEDKLFSYPIQEQYPQSLYIAPSIRCSHPQSDGGRPLGKEWVKMRVQNTWYLWHTLLQKQGIWAYIAFWWANIGDIVIASFAVLAGQQSSRFILWHIEEYWQLLWRKKI